MKVTESYLTDFIRQEFPGFLLMDLQTYRGKKRVEHWYRLKISGTAGGEKLKILSLYTPATLSKELKRGYKLVLKHEHNVIIIDLKKVSSIE